MCEYLCRCEILICQMPINIIFASENAPRKLIFLCNPVNLGQNHQTEYSVIHNFPHYLNVIMAIIVPHVKCPVLVSYSICSSSGKKDPIGKVLFVCIHHRSIINHLCTYVSVLFVEPACGMQFFLILCIKVLVLQRVCF